MYCGLLLTFVVLHLASPMDGHRILVTSVGMAASQNLIMGRLADVLGENGHNVTLLRWIMLPETKAVKLKYANEVTFNLFQDDELIQFMRANAVSMAWEKNPIKFPPWPLGLMYKAFKTITDGCERLISDEMILKQLKSANFDVVIIHVADVCTFGLAEAFGIKSYAWFSTAFMYDFMAYYSGTASPVSYVPSGIDATDQMTFFERTKNLFFSVFFNTLVDRFVFSNAYNEMFRARFGADFADIHDIVRESQLLMINSDPFFEYARPTQHNVIYVGGLTMGHPVPLNEEWQNIVHNAMPDGLVLFSLGTVANTTGMPMEYKQRFLNVFKRFPTYTFIYRLEGALPDATGARNIVFPKWIPQKDLLANPKVKAFITHGGYNSLTEATYFGVPMVVLPLFGDQLSNSRRVERRNVGRVLDKDDLTEENIHRALDQVLGSKTIQTNADRMSEMMHKKPTSSLDLMLGWVNFLAEFKNLDSLKPESRNMGFIQYHMIDVFAFLTFFIALFLYFVIRCCRGCVSLLVSNKDKQKRE